MEPVNCKTTILLSCYVVFARKKRCQPLYKESKRTLYIILLDTCPACAGLSMIQSKLFHGTPAGASDSFSSAKSYKRYAVPPKEEERRWGKENEVGGGWGERNGNKHLRIICNPIIFIILVFLQEISLLLISEVG